MVHRSVTEVLGPSTALFESSLSMDPHLDLGFLFDEDEDVSEAVASDSNAPSSVASFSQHSQAPVISKPVSTKYVLREFKKDFLSTFRATLLNLAEDKVLTMPMSVFGPVMAEQCNYLLDLDHYEVYHSVANALFDGLGRGLWDCVGSARSSNKSNRLATATKNFHLFICNKFEFPRIVDHFRRLLTESDALRIPEEQTFDMFVRVFTRRLFSEAIVKKLQSMTVSQIDEIDADLDAAESLREVIVYVLGFALSQLRRGSRQHNNPRWQDLGVALCPLFTLEPGSSGLDDDALGWVKEKSKGGLLIPVVELATFFFDQEKSLSNPEVAQSSLFWSGLSGPLAAVIRGLVSQAPVQPQLPLTLDDLTDSLLNAYRRIYAKGLSRRLTSGLSSGHTEAPGTGAHPIRDDLHPTTSSPPDTYHSSETPRMDLS